MDWAAILVLSISCFTANSVSLSHIDDSGEKKLHYLVEPPVYAEVSAPRGGNVTLPCVMHTKPPHYRIKWVKLEPHHQGVENIVLITNGHALKHYGALGPRASLRDAHPLDASLRISNLELGDGGEYRCELINGIEDEKVEITLSIDGIVFPYGRHGRYKMNFAQAKAACAEQDAIMATYKQLFKAWTDGLDWCNAGWLNDGTVHYPILHPRAACGGDLLPGIRSYGPRHRIKDHFDTFCFTSATSGTVFYLGGSFNFAEAEQACRVDGGGELARVGQLYAAWRYQDLDQCNGGWLQDGSVRFPIVTPRKHCGGLPEAGVRSLGFPKKTHRLYGAYCYR
ncbi:hyaluronan and proteoglycan link protein 2 [Engraulis encrasicolus]|uniref:hyaluronan and proteoglycan link protein 2 n=1 Tax=Engraulis encrasicolus TaxID=184585 RepID=UPI002FD35B16